MRSLALFVLFTTCAPVIAHDGLDPNEYKFATATAPVPLPTFSVHEAQDYVFRVVERNAATKPMAFEPKGTAFLLAEAYFNHSKESDLLPPDLGNHDQSLSYLSPRPE